MGEPQPPGRNYIKCAPLSFKAWLGSPINKLYKILNDVCSNVSVIDSDKLRILYPHIKPNDDVKLEVKGIGKTLTMGYVKIPLWVEVIGDNRQRCLIMMEGEFYVVYDFEYGIMIGMDMVTDYRIDLHISKNKAIRPRFSYDMKSTNMKFQSIPVNVKYDLTIHSRICRAILIKLYMTTRKDCIFCPYQFQ